MKNLKDILYGVRITEVNGTTDRQILNICIDSRKVKNGSLFIALKGTETDGHQFIEQVIQQGAVAIICENMPGKFSSNISFIRVKSSEQSAGIIADNFYNNPSSKLKLIGVTGTNGKTTIVTLLFNLFRELGINCGMLSTVKNQINDEIFPATHTTPDTVSLNELLAKMVETKCQYCFMEVSSHAVVQNRIAGLKFTGGIFTNITHDHLDYHLTFDNYIEAKKKFFDGLSADAFALTNQDDKCGKVMLQNCNAKKYTYGLRTIGDYKVKVLENNLSGLILNLDGMEIHSLLIGEFNVYNLLAVYAVARLLDQDKMEVLRILSKLKSAEGRFDYVVSEKNKIVGIVDYAHTPDAMKKVLLTIKNIRTGNEKVITIIGCGGNRDKTKRPLMAKVACELSNQIILTSDNPRNEIPEEIIKEMEAGVEPQHKKKCLSITDRKEAIKVACAMAEANDIILLAGKGHEKYQEIKGERFPFDDKKILIELMMELEK